MFEIYEKNIVDFNLNKKKEKKDDEFRLKESIKDALKKIPGSGYRFNENDEIKKNGNTFVFEITKTQDVYHKYSKYLLDLSVFIKELELRSKNVCISKMDADYLDDIISVEIAIRMK